MMNENIKQFAKQAEHYASHSGSDKSYDLAFQEKFAELIIRESIKVAIQGADIENSSRTKSLKSYGQLNAALKIKEHFQLYVKNEDRREIKSKLGYSRIGLNNV